MRIFNLFPSTPRDLTCIPVLFDTFLKPKSSEALAKEESPQQKREGCVPSLFSSIAKSN